MLGTELADFAEPLPAFDPSRLYGLAFGSGNYYDTQPGGGEVGDGTTGFGAFYLLHVASIPATTQIVFNNVPFASPSAGHTLQGASSALRGTAYRDTTNNTLTPSRPVTSTDVGRLVVFGYAYDPGTTRLRAYADRQEVGIGTAMSTYVAATLSSRLGVYRDGSLPTTSLRVLSSLTYRGVLSAANVTALFDAIRTAGDMPTSLTGATLTHRWSLRDVLVAANVIVPDGSPAPTTLPDTVTAASADAYTKVGAPVVRDLGAVATPRMFTYETTPIYRGSDQGSSANYHVSSFDDATLASGFWWALLGYFPAGTNAATVLAGAATASAGWDVRVAANHATASWSMGDGTTYTSSATSVLSTGRVSLLVGTWDQANLRQRLYNNRLEAGTGTARTAYAPPAATKIFLGRSPRDAGTAGTRPILGFAQGNGTPTLAQVQALYDAIASTDSMQGIPGMTSVLVDYTLDGGNPATLTNRAGAGTFARTGSPTLGQVYSRAYSW